MLKNTKSMSHIFRAEKTALIVIWLAKLQVETQIMSRKNINSILRYSWCVVTCIKERFEQKGHEMYATLEQRHLVSHLRRSYRRWLAFIMMILTMIYSEHRQEHSQKRLVGPRICEYIWCYINTCKLDQIANQKLDEWSC